MNKAQIIGLYRLFRFELSFTAGICVFVGQLLPLGHLPSLNQAVFGFLSFFFISATALILNSGLAMLLAIITINLFTA